MKLAPGDQVVIFSDGLSEALSADGEEFGDARILDVLERSPGNPPHEVVERLIGAVRQFACGATQNDDITVLVLRYGR